MDHEKTGRASIIDFVNDSRAMIERISFEVHYILAGDDRAVILGSLASRLKRIGKIIETDFAIVLTVANGESVRFQMLEDKPRFLPSRTRLTRLFWRKA